MPVTGREAGTTYLPAFINGATGVNDSPFVTQEDINGQFLADFTGLGLTAATTADAINELLADGYIVRLANDVTISKPLLIDADGAGLDLNGNTLTLSTAAGAFDNVTFAGRFSLSGTLGNKYAIGIYSANTDRPVVKNGKIKTSAWAEYRFLTPIYFNNCTSIEIADVEITGFCRGYSISVDDCTGKIVRNNIHDNYTKAATLSNGVTTIDGDTAQMTGIAVDYDCTVGSTLHIANNTIQNITHSAAILAVMQTIQTDGINLQGTGSKPSKGCQIVNNRIVNVGEGIDCFGSDNVISGNTIERCFSAGIKFMHGASRNVISGNSIREVGLCGVYSGASNSDNVGETLDNMIQGNIISNVNRAISWFESDGTAFYTSSAGSTFWSNTYNGGAGTITAAVRFDVVTGYPYQNKFSVIRDNIFSLGGNGDYGIYIEGNSGGGAQYAGDNRTSDFEDGVYLDSQGYITFS